MTTNIRKLRSGAVYAVFFVSIVTLATPHTASSQVSGRAQAIGEISQLIDAGELDRARHIMSQLANAGPRSSSELVQRSRLADNGDAAREFLEAALKTSQFPREREYILLSLARYYQAGDSLNRLEEILSQYEREFPRGAFSEEMAAIQAYAQEKLGQPTSARDLSERIKRSAVNADVRARARLTSARLGLQQSSTRSTSIAQLRELSAASGSVAAPEALYLLAQQYVEDKRFDDAALTFSILREAYPNSIGSSDLIDIISNLDESRPDNTAAEDLIGGYYRIQVGVFSVKDNAKSQKDRFERYGKPVDIVDKVISGQRYYAVYVGKFKTVSSADAFKQTLERSENELFNIVLLEK